MPSHRKKRLLPSHWQPAAISWNQAYLQTPGCAWPTTAAQYENEEEEEEEEEEEDDESPVRLSQIKTRGNQESEPEDEALPQTDDPRKELAERKKKKGALRFINEHTMATKDCILAVGKAAWKHHANKARSILSPLNVLE